MASLPPDEAAKQAEARKEAEAKDAAEKQVLELTALSATATRDAADRLAEASRLAAEAAEEGVDFKVKGGTLTGSSIRKAYAAYLDKLSLSPEKKAEYQKDADDGKFHFQSEEDVENFFQGLANANESFMARHVEGGNPLGDYYLSFGDGKLLKGNIGPVAVATLAESWEKIKDNPEAQKELAALLDGAIPENGAAVIACLKKYTPAPEPTADARAAFAAIRRGREASAPKSLDPPPDPEVRTHTGPTKQ